MKVVLQVVKNASVTIDDKLYSSIDEGLLLLVGFTQGDNEEIIKKVIDKIISLRIFLDENGKTNLAFLDGKREILCVSQFTLYADIKKGRRPSFVKALEPTSASSLYDFTLSYIRSLGVSCKQGVFGADMKVNLLNDGPFTLTIDSEDL